MVDFKRKRDGVYPAKGDGNYSDVNIVTEKAPGFRPGLYDVTRSTLDVADRQGNDQTPEQAVKKTHRGQEED